MGTRDLIKTFTVQRSLFNVHEPKATSWQAVKLDSYRLLASRLLPFAIRPARGVVSIGLSVSNQECALFRRSSLIARYALLFIFCSLLFAPAVVASDLIVPADGTARVAIAGSGSALGRTEKAAFEVEVVSSAGSMRRGLSGRSHMPEDRGMLFVLTQKNLYFWMKGMEFPLDILFFDRGGKLLVIHEHLQPCDACPSIRPPDAAAYALEINAGISKNSGIIPGDRMIVEDK